MMTITIPLTADSNNSSPLGTMAVKNSDYTTHVFLELDGRIVGVNRKQLRAALDALDIVAGA